MIGRLLAAVLDAQSRWANPLGNFLQRVVAAVFRRIWGVKDLLNGKWLGHSLHAALTDVPIGALVLALLFDVLNVRPAADIALAVVLIGMVAAAIAGLADYADTDDRARWVATVHLTTMVIAQVVLGVSLYLRLADPLGDRSVATALLFAGFAIVMLGAWIGGEIVYALGNMVNRHAWRFGDGPGRWVRLDTTEIPDGVPTAAKAGPATLLVVRQGATVYALHSTCAHAGGPLPEGKIVDGCIECPWHGSRFELASGRRKRGPSTFDQPRYEVRAADGGGWEVRRLDAGTGQNV